jgi:CelD/BcsL family acetyltransferase involved in cellulose biosynthesis
MLESTFRSRLRIDLYSSFPDARPAWRRFEELGSFYAFQSYDWLACWHDCIGKPAGIRPCLVAVEDIDAGPLLFLPLGIKRRHGLSCLTWLGGRVTDYHAPILGPGLERFCRTYPFQALWSHLKAHLPPCDVVHFEKQPEAIEGRANPFVELSVFPNAYNAHAVELRGQWEELYRRKCSSKAIKKDRYNEGRLSKLGALTLSLGDGEVPVGTIIDGMIHLKRRQYHRTGATDPLRSSGFRDFYHRLSERQDGSVRVHTACLKVGDRIAAVHWGVICRGRFHYMMPAFDDELFSETSPGSILLRRLLEWACDNDVQVFDFGLGDEPYKERWCESTLRLWDYLEPLTLGGRVYAAEIQGLKHLKRFIHASPALAPIMSKVKRVLHRSRGAS